MSVPASVARMKVRLGRLDTLSQLQGMEICSRASVALSRGAAGAAVRRIDETRPETWEFGGFSMHGEDGVLDVLTSKLLAPERTFIEIGAADGLANCTAWLAIARNNAGLMIEADPDLATKSKVAMETLGRIAVHCAQSYVTAENVGVTLKLARSKTPDVLSLDIDGMDYWVAKSVLDSGVLPKIIVVEYNSTFGPDAAVTVPYSKSFDRTTAHESWCYYGASVQAFRKLFGANGYDFVAVDTMGVNSFFVHKDAFPAGFAESVVGSRFRNNNADLNPLMRPAVDEVGDLALPAREWKWQYERIKHLPVVEV
jgi:hypothetical protein